MADAQEGSYEYKLFQSGPLVAENEVESAAEAIEIRILWGRNQLTVQHLSPPRPFTVGEEGCDYSLPTEKLGTAQLPLVVAGPAVQIPQGATGRVQRSGQASVSLAEAAGGSSQIALQHGTTVRVELNDIVFEIAAVHAGKKAVGSFTLAALTGGAMLYVLGSFAGHAGLFGALAMLMPDMSLAGDDTLSDDNRKLIQQFFDTQAELEEEEKETEQTAGERRRQQRGRYGNAGQG